MVAGMGDVEQLNVVFTEAFTERYRKDGLAGVRVPPLSAAIWRYALEDAGDGALCWRDGMGRIVAFNMVHCSGTEGWMGPLCVGPMYQGSGLGKRVVKAGMEWLEARGVTVVGLETMPRTMDNIGFYSSMGFVPGHLTLTLTLNAKAGERSPQLLSRFGSQEHPAVLEACRLLLHDIMPGYDFTREIDITERHSLGDTVVMGDPARPRGFALWHSAPLVDGRVRDELRVLKLVLRDLSTLPEMMADLTEMARRAGLQRVALRLQGDYSEAYRILMGLGARVRWTDLRMTLYGWGELPPAKGMVLSNWEV